MLPICPFCRKHVESGAIWCTCGVNLSRYPKLPTAPNEIKEWLLKYAPEEVSTFNSEPGRMLITAKESLLKEQDAKVSEKTHHYLDLAAAEKLIEEFLFACEREKLAPTLDIGQLRRERWRQWRHIPAKYRLHPPLKDFRVKPGYLIQIPVAKFTDEFCLAIDGTFYKHQLNAQDPFPLEELLRFVPLNNLAEALNFTLVDLLKTKQQPVPETRGFFRKQKSQAEANEQVKQEQPQKLIKEEVTPTKEKKKTSKLGLVWQMLRSSKAASKEQEQVSNTLIDQPGQNGQKQATPTHATYVPLDAGIKQENLKPLESSEQDLKQKVVTVKIGQTQEQHSSKEEKEPQADKGSTL